MRVRRDILLAVAITIASVVCSLRAQAAEHIIEMRNANEAGDRMVFVPAFVKVEPGDTVKFVPTDKNHNAESVKEIWPDGVPMIKGAYSREIVFTAEKDGLYFFKCLPHYGMGMVALVQVGKPTNLDKMKEFKAMGLAHNRLTLMLMNIAN